MSIGLVLMVFVSGFLGTMVGYQMGTGTSMFTQGKDTILPPEQETDTTTEQVIKFVENKETDLDKYSQGYNCVESALLLARSAEWEGFPVLAVRIDFKASDQPPHMLLAFPVVDNGGWIFIDPLTESEVKPRIGGSLAGSSEIVGMYYLETKWIPFEEITE